MYNNSEIIIYDPIKKTKEDKMKKGRIEYYLDLDLPEDYYPKAGVWLSAVTAYYSRLSIMKRRAKEKEIRVTQTTRVMTLAFY
jgi:hypothetical protein